MNTLLITTVLGGLATIVVAIYLLIKAANYNHLRELYLEKFQFYKSKNFVNDSYCNIYIEMFSKFRFHMFYKFVINGETTLYGLTDNITLYSNYRLSLYKTRGSDFDVDKANEIFKHWHTK